MKLPHLALFTALALVSCQSTPPNLTGLVQAVSSATADGVVTPDETASIVAQMPKPGFDWLQAAQVAGSIGAAILGVKIIPDRHLRSPFDQPQQS